MNFVNIPVHFDFERDLIWIERREGQLIVDDISDRKVISE